MSLGFNRCVCCDVEPLPITTDCTTCFGSVAPLQFQVRFSYGGFWGACYPYTTFQGPWILNHNSACSWTSGVFDLCGGISFGKVEILLFVLSGPNRITVAYQNPPGTNFLNWSLNLGSGLTCTNLDDELMTTTNGDAATDHCWITSVM